MNTEPTAAQSDQCLIVQHEFVELINRLAAEGFDYRVMLAGISAATAATVTSFLSARDVPLWFARQAALTFYMSNPGKD